MDLLGSIGRTLGFSFAAGLNLYATVAILGLASRFGWVALPDQYRVFDNNWIIGIALTLYVIEFFADKIPWLDSAWDAVHTFIRPVGGALATSTHLSKTGTRVLANASPEPFTNWMLSLGEDAFVVGLSALALAHPAAAAIVVLVCVGFIIAFLTWIVKLVGRRFRTAA